MAKLCWSVEFIDDISQLKPKYVSCNICPQKFVLSMILVAVLVETKLNMITGF